METKDKILNVLGDSITEGANATAFDKSYHQVLKKLGDFKEVNAYGIGGTRIARQTVLLDGEKAEDNFISRCEKMKSGADIVIIFGGTNDYGHGDAPFGKVTDNTDETFCGACNVLFTKIRRLYEAAQIIVLLPLQRLYSDNPRGQDGKKAVETGTLEEYSVALKKIAEKHQLIVCNLRDDELLNPNDEEKDKKYFGDGLHPNDVGHEILADRIYKFIKEL